MASLPRIAALIKASTSLFLVILLLNSPSSTEAGNVLYPGEILRTGDYLTQGCDRALIMQRDCNLVLYESGTPLWASNTGGLARDCVSTVLSDGELVVRTAKGHILWRSGVTGSRGDYALVLQCDLNLVIYGSALWATGPHKALTNASLAEGAVAAA